MPAEWASDSGWLHEGVNVKPYHTTLCIYQRILCPRRDNARVIYATIVGVTRSGLATALLFQIGVFSAALQGIWRQGRDVWMKL